MSVVKSPYSLFKKIKKFNDECPDENLIKQSIFIEKVYNRNRFKALEESVQLNVVLKSVVKMLGQLKHLEG